MTLPTDHKARKGIPIYSGLLKYFPDACAAVAELSRVANEQHNPGEPMHWAREKSTDHHDCLVRHAMQAGTRDTDGIRHSTKVAWRALAIDQLEAESEAKKPKPGQLVAREERQIDPWFPSRFLSRLDFDSTLNHYQSVPIYHA